MAMGRENGARTVGLRPHCADAIEHLHLWLNASCPLKSLGCHYAWLRAIQKKLTFGDSNGAALSCTLNVRHLLAELIQTGLHNA